MVQFLSIIFFLGFLQFLLGFSKVPDFCVTLYIVSVSLRTTSPNIQKFYSLPTEYLNVLYVSQEKHRSFPYTTLNDRLF